jgi:hypothetical protein
MTMCTSIVKSVARQSRNQKIGYLAQRRKGAKIKMSCHFDRREKSFLDLAFARDDKPVALT